jgi:hypothetical protein
MVNITRRKAIGGVGGLVLLGACMSAVDPEDSEAQASRDDTSDGGNGGNGDDGNGGNGDDANGDDGNGENGENGDDQEDGSEPDVSEPETQSFSGSGAAVEDVSIEGGLVTVDAEHSGDRNFSVHFVGDGDYDDMLVNHIGEYSGVTADLLDAGDYQLDVEADGEWSIEVAQPRAASGDAPSSIEGDGPNILGPFEFDGSHTAVSSHSGERNFVVRVLDPEGEQFVGSELVVNEIGEYDGETTFRFDGVGYVAVQADGDWSLDLE